MSRALALAALAAVTAAACQMDAGGRERIHTGDAALFDDHVQPYLEARCATLDCHGVAGRPLRLYSELGLRRDGALRPSPVAERNEPEAITAEELADNRSALAGIAAGERDVSAHLALRKPLALDAGGIAHEGGVHWASTHDSGYLCLRGYLGGDVEGDPATHCARALAAATPP